MIHVFYRNRNTIGQLMVALMFLSGAVFMFTFDGFVSESGATGCCSGGETAVPSFAADSSGDYGSDILMDASATDGCCGGEDKVIPSSSNNGSTKCTCATNCSCKPSEDDCCKGSRGCTEGASCCYEDGSHECRCSAYCRGNTSAKCDPGGGTGSDCLR